MELDELLALMAAQIYAAQMNAAFVCRIDDAGWEEVKRGAMETAVKDARTLWGIAQTQAP